MKKRTLAAIALSSVLLPGCGGGTTEVARTETPTMPNTSASTQATGQPSGSAAPSPSAETVTTPVAPTPSTVPTSSAPETQPAAPTTAPAPTKASAPSASVPPVQPPPPSRAPTTASADGSWVSMDVTVTTAAGAAALSETSSDFRAFVASRVATPDASGCVSELTVQAFHPAGFAAGQDFAPGCGGSQNIWASVAGKWQTIMAMQSVVECSQMETNNIPRGLPDIPCLDANGDLTDW